MTRICDLIVIGADMIGTAIGVFVLLTVRALWRMNARNCAIQGS